MTIQTMDMMGTNVTGFKTDAEKWQAVRARDKTADGQFYFSVATTGVYCRPSCGARLPNRENVAFHNDRDAAEAAGFRPCKRCRPDSTPSWQARAAMVAEACRFIEDAETSPTLEDVAAHAGLSPHHFHRVFKEVTGVTPKAYATAHRTKAVKAGLKTGGTVTDAIYDAGYGASSRFYEKADGFLGMSPKAYKAGGKGQTVRYSIRPSALGRMLIAATDKGICMIQFGDDDTALTEALSHDFPDATLTAGDAVFDAWADAALALVETGAKPEAGLPLDIQGTAFQQKVWQALQAIPPGETASYKEVAEAIGDAKAVRAVARACASNRIAVAIPCHRVVRSDGGISGYRWGVERKRVLLSREKKA
ncbi:bifunctional DNA-binding transcriptional regulator/O6-methylguanine-DNA methyltransferase Ada [Kordiimonas marina]|uniref:bifunctional DNA-binding transcriptional regulator/O6-methylguanine-DNA methyltransferase Ada n=1 Tax=Kordiimonas marina TaxID=2872312 RepID=UPI001FF2A03D|nr:bifunctional DNA-binding transcriptional regulator/O6-methylguanine-DNA methyltransferase Ada [Kordiimonas marina]MCJ9429345.1 bifunctional DNA-binding transcriptional regulator/O6-methylguanine-DNA methyltransferase Ada [Kordiimonas marina]